MGPGLRLELKQSQQLVMTPQLQQAIRLLQLSNLELGQWLEEARERNPLLELDGDYESVPAEREPETTPEPDLPAVAYENLYGGGALPLQGGSGSLPSLEERLADAADLPRHLTDQIGRMRASAVERLVATQVIDALDEHGYLREPLPVIAERLGIPLDVAERALALVQACEPTGVGARSLPECLALQLAERDRLDPAMQALLDNLDVLAEGKGPLLRRLTGMDDEDLADAIAEIRALDPRPCSEFSSALPDPVVPDVFVRRTEWGGLRVELNMDTLPRVLIDRAYAAELERGGTEARRFVAECRAEAGWLVRSLESRARTILKIATEIVRVQERFFEEGAAALQPLTLKMVADATGLHESTASRVTSGKFLASDRGTFELKYFFTNAVGGEDDGAFGAASVRHRIRTMVDAEAPDAVLSDDAICDRLAAEGIEIARRTVAKYRKSLKIPSSVDRRRQKALNALM